MIEPGADLCRATEFLDYREPTVEEFIERVLSGARADARSQAVGLYYAVRDGVHYEIYGADLSRRGLRASEVLTRGRGLCIHKSILYAACMRALGIPSRLEFVDVRNHLLSPRLRVMLGGDVLRFHCLTRIYLDGRWIKVAPVFSARLCRLYRMTPLEFDGRTDAVLQAHDDRGQSFIQVVHEHGEFDDLPYEQIVEGLQDAHGGIFASATTVRAGSLVAEAPGR